MLELLAQLFLRLPEPDYVALCLCNMFLDKASEVAAILKRLIVGSKDEELLAYQIGFELAGDEVQHFLDAVRNELPAPASLVPEGSHDNHNKVRMDRLLAILRGETATALYLDFLCRSNRADPLVLSNIQGIVPPRNSITHLGIVLANAIMHAGTSVDTFVRDNFDFLKRSSNWSKFSTTAAIGVIYKGSLRNSLNILSEYLPQPGRQSSPYVDGGGYYALGLIHSGQGGHAIPTLQGALQSSMGNTTILHGACLGLGLAGMASQNLQLYDQLVNTLFTVLCPPTGLPTDARRMTPSRERRPASLWDLSFWVQRSRYRPLCVTRPYLGQNALEQMLSYAHETQHEKIIRGWASGGGDVRV